MADDLRLARSVAIKLLLPGVAEQPESRLRFAEEARAAARLSHPNVVAIFDTGEHVGRPYIVMELLPGRTLRDEVLDGPFTERRAREVGVQVLRRASSRARVGRDPSRYQAGEHPPDRIGRGQGGRLRNREGRRVDRSHRDRPRDRNPLVSRARSRHRWTHDRRERSLRRRRRALRGTQRAETLRRRLSNRGVSRDLHGDTATAPRRCES